MALDLTAYRSTLGSLRRSIERSTADPDGEELRDSVIQRFEYTYELAWRTLRRYLDAEGVSEIAMFSKRDLFREAAIQGLIEDPESWFAYQKARNETSHTYNALKAKEVHAAAMKFAVDAEVLVTELDRRRFNA